MCVHACACACVRMCVHVQRGTGDSDPRSGDFPESPKRPCLLLHKQAARPGEASQAGGGAGAGAAAPPRAVRFPRSPGPRQEALLITPQRLAAGPGLWGRGRQAVNSCREAPGLSVLAARGQQPLGQACGSGRGRSAGQGRWGGVGAGLGAVETGSQPRLGPCPSAQPGSGPRGSVRLELWSRSATGPGSVRRRRASQAPGSFREVTGFFPEPQPRAEPGCGASDSSPGGPCRAQVGLLPTCRVGGNARCPAVVGSVPGTPGVGTSAPALRGVGGIWSPVWVRQRRLGPLP